MVVERIRMVAKLIKEDRKTEEFVQEYHRLLSQKEIIITDININNQSDRWLVLESALRGKSEDEYSSLVFGLIERSGKEKNKEKKEVIDELVSSIVSIGERNLDIDWS